MVDWGDTGSMLGATAAWVNVLVLIWIAYLGREGLEKLRQQRIAERQVETAEDILKQAYLVNEAIKAVFSTVQKKIIKYELTERSDEELSEALYQRIVVEIFDQLASFEQYLNPLTNLRPVGKAFYGDDVADAIGTIQRVATGYNEAYRQMSRIGVSAASTRGSLIGIMAIDSTKDLPALKVLEHELIPLIRPALGS